MANDRSLLADACVTGVVTALATFAVPSLLRAARGASVAAPVNAESHGLWGDEATTRDDVSARFTGVGAATHLGACVFWSGLYEAAMGDAARTSAATDFRGAAGTALAVYVIDYQLLPKRLTPGFEHRYSAVDMIAFFATLIGVLPVRRMLARRARSAPPDQPADAARVSDQVSPAAEAPPRRRPTPRVFADRMPFGTS